VSDAVRRHLAAADAVTGDARCAAAVADRAARVLRPAGAFAALDEVAAWLGAWQRRVDPGVDRPAAVVFVADHGVARRAVSAYPSQVTAMMLDALRSGTATAAVLCRAGGVHLEVVDVGVGRPTGDLTVEDALDPGRFERTWFDGARAVARLDADVVVLGEMGIGNTTAAAAVAAGLFGGGSSAWCGRGTGIDDEGLARKRRAVAEAVTRLGPGPDPLEVLRRVGGAELVAIAGAVTEARLRSLPVLLDGFIVTAAAAAVTRAASSARFLDHTWAAHRSGEVGHGLLLDRFGKAALLDLDLRLGEASGALVALPVVRAAALAVTGVATFEEAAMPGPNASTAATRSGSRRSAPAPCRVPAPGA
jgi:nicotinate-nucleotide--dimethylbenzimidazole phosphoribosyltransferase